MFIGLALLFAVIAVLIYLQLRLLTREYRQLKRDHKLLRTNASALSERVALDDLTPAQSRRFLADRIDRSVRTHTHALLYVDLDDFKSVNDGYGHTVGDDLLVCITQALVDTCREQDFVARLGGDEFCVFLHQCDLTSGTHVAQRFRQAVMQARVNVNGVWVQRTASIGVAELHPDQGMADALHIADAALYDAKQAGRNRVQAADATVRAELVHRKNKPTPEDVAAALERGDITYFVQPIFDLTTRKAIGVEALLRWVTDTGEVLSPDAFLDVMTANYKRDMKPPLDAANTLASTFTGLSSPLFVAWNISTSFLGRSARDDQAWLDELLRGVDPALTVFEIVETAVIDNPENTKRLLASLRAAGVRVALDDFGTGLSNLERLVEYPVDIVKIDRRFVMRLDYQTNPAILKGLVAMGRQVGFDIIAEGVETAHQLDVLRGIGITKAQGHYLGKPESIYHWHDALKSGYKSP